MWLSLGGDRRCCRSENSCSRAHARSRRAPLPEDVALLPIPGRGPSGAGRRCTSEKEDLVMSQTFGRTRWKRFAIVMVPTIAATAAVGVSIAQGALAASFSVSGQQFKVSAGKLVGQGFTQYGTVLSHDTSQATNANTAVPVAVSGFTTATINQLCQSVAFPTPFGNYTLTINAGGTYDATTDTSTGPQVDASNLFISMADLK